MKRHPGGAGPAPSASRIRFIIFTLVLSGIVSSLVQSVVAPLFPALQASTGASLPDLSWLITATLVAGGVFAPIITRLGDTHGVRLMMTVSLALLAAGAAICALTTWLPALIAGRTLQGAGLAVIPLGMATLRRILPPKQAMKSAGTLSASMGAGAALGVPFAGLVVQYSDWHVMFWVMCALSLTGMVLVIVSVPADPQRGRALFDVVGALLLTITIVSLLLAFTKGPEWGWGSPLILGLFVLTIAATLSLFCYERTASVPLVDFKLNSRRPLLMANLSAILVGFGFYGNTFVTALLVQEPAITGYGLGLGVAATGLTLLPGGLGVLFLSPVSARLSVRFGPRFTLLLGTAIMSVGFVLRIFSSTDLVYIVIGASVISIGTGLAFAAYPALIQCIVSPRETASVNGINTLARYVGSAICGGFISVILSSLTFVAGGKAYPTLVAYQVVFLIGAAACALGMLFIALIGRQSNRPG